MPVKACSTVAVLRSLSCRLFDITDEMSVRVADINICFVSFSDTVVFPTESQVLVLLPNATHLTVISFTTSDVISV